MKKFLPVILLATVMLAGCTSQSISESSIKDDSGTKMTADQIFEKKQECAKYKDSLQKEINNTVQELSELDNYYSEDIREIFYSQSLNSCFAIIDKRLNRGQTQLHYKVVIDLLTNDMTNYDENNPQDLVYYYEKIKQLKGE